MRSKRNLAASARETNHRFRLSLTGPNPVWAWTCDLLAPGTWSRNLSTPLDVSVLCNVEKGPKYQGRERQHPPFNLFFCSLWFCWNRPCLKTAFKWSRCLSYMLQLFPKKTSGWNEVGKLLKDRMKGQDEVVCLWRERESGPFEVVQQKGDFLRVVAVFTLAVCTLNMWWDFAESANQYQWLQANVHFFPLPSKWERD